MNQWAIFPVKRGASKPKKQFANSTLRAKDDPAFSNFNLPLPEFDELDYQFEDLESLTPPNSELRKLAEQYPPPASWFEGEEECPF